LVLSERNPSSVSSSNISSSVQTRSRMSTLKPAMSAGGRFSREILISMANVSCVPAAAKRNASRIHLLSEVSSGRKSEFRNPNLVEPEPNEARKNRGIHSAALPQSKMIADRSWRIENRSFASRKINLGKLLVMRITRNPNPQILFLRSPSIPRFTNCSHFACDFERTKRNSNSKPVFRRIRDSVFGLLSLFGFRVCAV